MSVLSDLRIGETGVLVVLELPESVQNHLMHMGFVPDARVTVLRRAPDLRRSRRATLLPPRAAKMPMRWRQNL